MDVQAIFHNVKFWVQNQGTDRTIDLQCQATPWGYLLRKICRRLRYGKQIFSFICFLNDALSSPNSPIFKEEKTQP